MSTLSKGVTPEPLTAGEVDRRAFLNGVGAAAALAFAATAAPGPFARTTALEPSALAAGTAPGRALADSEAWEVDDIWGPAPRYALAVPHAPVRTSPVLWEHVDPIDRMLVI